MAVPRIQISDEKLQKRLKKYEEVTKKSIASTLRRSARLMAVNLAYSVPPYGKSPASRKLGEGALRTDLWNVFYVMTIGRIRGIIDFQGRSATMKYGHKGAQPLGNVTEKILRKGEMRGWHEKRRGVNGRTSKINRNVTTGHRIKDLRNLDKGIVTEDYLRAYYAERVKMVGLSKAPWAAAAIAIKADVKDALSGIPAWVKRHVVKAPHSVNDNATDDLPKITLTNKLPWADKALRKNDHAEAIRISRQKFYRSMGKEIKEALKKASTG